MSTNLNIAGLTIGNSYQLTNALLGPFVFLHYEKSNHSVYGSADALLLILTIDTTTQTNSWDGYNTFALCTNTDSAVQRCLGVNPVGGASVTLYFRSESGAITPPYLRWTSRQDSNNFLRLEDDLMGKGWYLDTYSDTFQTYMGRGDLTGQY